MADINLAGDSRLSTTRRSGKEARKSSDKIDNTSPEVRRNTISGGFDIPKINIDPK